MGDETEETQSLGNLGMEKDFVFCSLSNTFLLLFIGLVVVVGSIVGIVAAVDPAAFGLVATPEGPTPSPTELPTTFSVPCRCISLICVPTEGLGGSSPQQVQYPADGTLMREGSNWCFVEESCPTTQVGDNTTCVGAKFGFTDGSTAMGFTDTRPVRAIPTADVASSVTCKCRNLECIPSAGPDEGNLVAFAGDGSIDIGGNAYCFVEEDCATTQVGTNQTCLGEKFGFLDGSLDPEGDDQYPVFAMPLMP